MFTGIVQDLGKVQSFDQIKTGFQLSIIAKKSFRLRVGDSLAVNGCCLTVTEKNQAGYSFQVIPETIEKTDFCKLQIGSRVNLEPPVKAQDLLSGHLVSGHIDDVGKIKKITRNKDGVIMQINYAPKFGKYLINKGSIAVDGVSLTIVKATENNFTVALIDETLNKTTLGIKKKNDLVNLEFDLIAKYLESIVKHEKTKR